MAIPLLAAAALFAVARDGDGDGWPDSVSLGPATLHAVLTKGAPTAVPAAREYDVPPSYAFVLVSKAFLWDKRFSVVDATTTAGVARFRREGLPAEMQARVAAAGGGTRLTITAQGRAPSGPEEQRAVAEAYACFEDLLFNGIPVPPSARSVSAP